MNLLKISSVVAILLALIFFSHSILNLLGFAVSNKAITLDVIPENLKSFVTYILTNFLTIIRSFTIMESLFGALIFFTFERIAKLKNLQALRITSILALIAVLLPGISTLFSMGSFSFIFADNTISLILGSTFILFGVSLIRIKTSSWEMLTSSLGILQILEGLVLISTFWIPLRLVEFSIAIYILQAVFFWKFSKFKK